MFCVHICAKPPKCALDLGLEVLRNVSPRAFAIFTDSAHHRPTSKSRRMRRKNGTEFVQNDRIGAQFSRR
jgi:hypothetical protein